MCCTLQWDNLVCLFVLIFQYVALFLKQRPQRHLEAKFRIILPQDV